MVRRLAAVTVIVGALAGCGQRGSSAAADRADDAARSPRRDASVAGVELPPLALGLASADGFGWRKRPGQVWYTAARHAEGKNDWARVVDRCEKALAADPTHLEARWLYAVALAEVGRTRDVLAPLAIAIAGDFAKWGRASLEQPAFAAFLATPTGAAWRRAIDRERARFIAALADAHVVIANGDLFAVELDHARPKRWYRLTHTFGGVVAALAAPTGKQLAYAVRRRAHTGSASERRIAVGLVDLARGYTSHELDPGGAATQVAYSARAPIGFWVGATTAAATTWRQIDDDGAFHPVAGKPARPPGAWLELAATTIRVHRVPVPNVTADWDDRQLASAIRIGSANRIISVPSPGLIDGNTVTWSADRAHLAFVALLDDRCTPTGGDRAAVFVADPASGTPRELERASRGLAVEWIGARTLAIAGDRGVSIVELGGATAKLDGASGLAVPRKQPRCIADADEPAGSDDRDDATSDDPRGD